ncbi:hypothetical protein CsatB_017186 [Cannabis sativa]|uniref:Uncharacterized protein n=1 Tax=Cannabis sativa TaxID=3483 RepID=A0A7J6HMV5_CANSA|nr:hypothetical protein F8388_019827 [Cannabis sativa]KAF4400852.1 hypothetical protein G4B88_004395 [Cannabis sativa]
MERHLVLRGKKKSIIEEKTKVQYFNHDRSKKGNGKEGKASRSGSPTDQTSNLCCKATEFLCSICMLCVLCPVAIAWCCIKLPCKLGLAVARRASDRACCGCGSENRVAANYSSFSDRDSDVIPEEFEKKIWLISSSK